LPWQPFIRPTSGPGILKKTNNGFFKAFDAVSAFFHEQGVAHGIRGGFFIPAGKSVKHHGQIRNSILQFHQKAQFLRLGQVRIENNQIEGVLMVGTLEHLPARFGQPDPITRYFHFPFQEFPNMPVSIRDQNGEYFPHGNFPLSTCQPQNTGYTRDDSPDHA
jgi:hypothetical protein